MSPREVLHDAGGARIGEVETTEHKHFYGTASAHGWASMTSATMSPAIGSAIGSERGTCC